MRKIVLMKIVLRFPILSRVPLVSSIIRRGPLRSSNLAHLT